VQFGGCGGQPANCLAIFPDWNYWCACADPSKQILNGEWKFPEAQPDLRRRINALLGADSEQDAPEGS
jgi:hypothetical protein